MKELIKYHTYLIASSFGAAIRRWGQDGLADQQARYERDKRNADGLDDFLNLLQGKN